MSGESLISWVLRNFVLSVLYKGWSTSKVPHFILFIQERNILFE